MRKSKFVTKTFINPHYQFPFLGQKVSLLNIYVISYFSNNTRSASRRFISFKKITILRTVLFKTVDKSKCYSMQNLPWGHLFTNTETEVKLIHHLIHKVK